LISGLGLGFDCFPEDIFKRKKGNLA
jgi:hypothetical protein